MIQRFQEVLGRRMKGSGRVGYCVVVGQWTGPETSDSSWSCSQPVDLANKGSIPGGKNESCRGGGLCINFYNDFL